MRPLLPLLLAGCATAGTFQTANTVGAGGWELGGDLSYAALVDPDGSPTLLLPRGVARVGLGERVEIGGSLGFDGARGYAKFQLTGEGSPVIASLAPGLRALPLPGDRPGGMVGLEQALLLGVPVGISQPVLTLRAAQDLGVVEQTALLVWGGGSFGWSFQLGEHVRLHPEVGAMTPLYVSTGSGSQVAVVQAGLGLVFRQPPRARAQDPVSPF